MKYISTIISFIGGTSSLVSIVATIIIGGGGVYHYYDKWVTVPVETAEKTAKTATKSLKKCSDNTILLEERLRQSEIKKENAESLQENAELFTIQAEANLTSCMEINFKLQDDLNVTKKKSYYKGWEDGYQDAKNIKCKNTGSICFDITSK